MLHGEIPVEPIGEIDAKPGYDDTLRAAVSKPLYQGMGMVSDLFPQMSSKEQRQGIANKLDIINQTLGDPRISNTQGAFDTVAELGASIATTLPLAAAGAEIGIGALTIGAGAVGLGLDIAGAGAAVDATVGFLRTPINKLVTSAAGDYLPGASIAEIASGTAGAYGAYKGMIIPEHIVENFNKQNDVLNKQQALTDWSKDNWGFLVPAIPLVPGYLLMKVLKVHGDAKIKSEYAKALLAQHAEIGKARKDILTSALERAKGLVETEKKGREDVLGAAKKHAEEMAEQQKKQSELEKEFDKALIEKRISPAEHAWMMEYLENPDDHKNLMDRGLNILNNAQIPMDRVTGRLWYQLIDNKSMKNMKQAFTDKIGSDLPAADQEGMMDYIVNNSFDASNAMVASHPELMPALQGFTAFARQKLSARAKTTKAAKAMLKEHVFVENPDIFDKEKFPYLRLNEVNKNKLDTMKRLDELKKRSQMFKYGIKEYDKFLKEAKEKYPDIEQELEYLKGNMLSQENIFKHIKEKGLPAKGAPYTIPAVVKEKLSIAKKLVKTQEIEEAKKLAFRQKQLEFETIPKEIERLTDEIESKLKHNYKNTEEYKRLEDLADTRDDAKQAIQYINMLHEYNRQEAMLNAMDSFVKMADSNVAKFADPQKVINYLHKRMEQNVPALKEFEKSKAEKLKTKEKAAATTEKPAAAKTEKGEAVEKPKVETAIIQKVDAESLVKEFNSDREKYEQFADNISALDELVECALEKLNA